MKKIVILLTIIISFIFNISNVYALDIKVDNVKVLDKSDTITINTTATSGLTITPKITFHNVSDYVIYKITFSGTDISKYEISKVTDNNTSEYIQTSYKYDKTLSSPLYITMKYQNATSNLSLNDINVSIALTGEGGAVVINDPKSNNINDVYNPQTGAGGIIAPLILLVIAIPLANYYFKNNKNNAILPIILLGLIIMIPLIAYAAQEEKINLVIKVDNITLGDAVPKPSSSSSSSSKPSSSSSSSSKPSSSSPSSSKPSSSSSSQPKPSSSQAKYYVLLYPNGGTGISEGQRFEYNDTTTFDKFPKVSRSGCSLNGWHIDSPTGTLYSTDVRASDNGKKLYANWSCANIANLNIKITKNAKYTLDKPIEEFLASKESSIAEYNAFIKNNVVAAGMSTREGVVAAAVSFINYLYDNYDTKLPYYLTGDAQIIGVSKEFGKTAPATYLNKLKFTIRAFDCSGFVSWAIKNGGYKFNRVKSAGFDDLFSSDSCNITNSNCKGKPGDLINMRGTHVKMIVAVDEKNNLYYVAEAVSNGLLIQTCEMHKGMYDYGTTKILHLDNFYNNNSNKQSY